MILVFYKKEREPNVFKVLLFFKRKVFAIFNVASILQDSFREFTTDNISWQKNLINFILILIACIIR